MTNYTTSKEGVTCVFDLQHQLIAVIHKDPKSRHNVFYKCEEMNMEDLEIMVGSDIIKTNEKNTLKEKVETKN